MNAKKGIGRIAKILSGLGWVALATSVLSGAGYGGFDSFFVLSLIGVAAFVLLQGIVWVIDGFMDDSEGDRSLFWPFRSKIKAKPVDISYPASAPNTRPDLVGVHGWLFFFVILLMVMSPLKIIAETSKNLTAAASAFPEIVNFPGWRHYETGSWITVCAVCAILIWTGWGLMRYRAPSSVRFVIAVMWVMPVVALIADSYLASVYLGIDFLSGIDTEAIGQTIGAMLGALVWTLYFMFSRRVKNTYYHELIDVQAHSGEKGRIEPKL